MEVRKTPDVQSNPEQKNNDENITVPGLKLYYRAHTGKGSTVLTKIDLSTKEID